MLFKMNNVTSIQLKNIMTYHSLYFLNYMYKTVHFFKNLNELPSKVFAQNNYLLVIIINITLLINVVCNKYNYV